MNAPQFDNLARSMIGTRRSVLAGALAAVGGLHAATGIKAKKKRKRRKKARPATPNAFGCINVGDACTSPTQCCSGICEGKKGKQTCRAHDEAGCEAGAEREYCGGTDVACTTSAGAPGLCATTTGNAGYCATVAECYYCATDLDCQLAGGGVMGPRAACVQCESCAQRGGTACATRDVIIGVQSRSSGALLPEPS